MGDEKQTPAGWGWSQRSRERLSVFRLGSALSPELGVGGTAEGNALPWPPSPSLKKKIPL